MEFQILYTEFITNDIVVYRDDEFSFDTETMIERYCSIQIGCEYLGLDVVAEDTRIGSISGYCPKTNWINTTLTFPDAQNGELHVLNEDLIRGVGHIYADDWRVHMDKNKGIVYLGRNVRPAEKGIFVKFLKNAVAVLDDAELCGIYIDLHQRD